MNNILESQPRLAPEARTALCRRGYAGWVTSHRLVAVHTVRG
jgi:hypothetical protein